MKSTKNEIEHFNVGYNKGFVEGYEQGREAAIEEYKPKLLAFICKKYNISLIDMNCTVDEFEQV